MNHLRTYGTAPFKIAVIHGGPGAGGEMAPVARALAVKGGILEPLQTRTSLNGQLEELKIILEQQGTLPVTLVGFSWGAWLSFIFAANYPAFVRKLILISSGPFEEKYAREISTRRFSRLSPEERTELAALLKILDTPKAPNRNMAFKRFGSLFAKADGYDPVNFDHLEIDYRIEIYQHVWQQAAELRRSKALLTFGKRIRCPVVAIHGADDPHPAEGVQKPLSAILEDFRFILLKHCGHRPWIERKARALFFDALKAELL